MGIHIYVHYVCLCYIHFKLTLGSLGYFYHRRPVEWGGVSRKWPPPSCFYIIVHRLTHLVCKCRSANYISICTNMYHVCLIYLPWQSWQPWIWLILWTNCKKGEEKWHSVSHFDNIDHRKSYLVKMFRSTSPLFTIAIIPNTLIIWLP